MDDEEGDGSYWSVGLGHYDSLVNPNKQSIVLLAVGSYTMKKKLHL